jgi:23S rRNA pseudouridine1911/1915/1917 synthase
MCPPVLLFTIEPTDAGARLDLFLSKRLGIGRRMVRRLLDAGQVELGGHAVAERNKSLLLRAGSAITIRDFQHPDSAQIIPNPDFPLTILAQGSGWVIVDKPRGVPVHPLDARESGSILNALICRFPQMQGIGEGGLRSGVVHRLDMDTSGTLLFATEQSAWRMLRDLFIQHQTTKIYRAIVAGRLTGSGRETMNLLITRHRPARVRAVDAADHAEHRGTRRCHLTWQAIESLSNATLIEIELGTGFLHQIRVMFQAKGHPVLGDTLYGGEVQHFAPRQMLHAAKLLVGPAHATSPDPQDFTDVLSRLRAPITGR